MLFCDGYVVLRWVIEDIYIHVCRGGNLTRNYILSVVRYAPGRTLSVCIAI